MTELTSLFAQHLMPNYGVPSVAFVRGEGPHLWDEEGKKYLDFLSGLAVTSLGHSHHSVTKAISDQADKLLHVSNLFANEHHGLLAASLDKLISGDGPLLGGKTFFCNSGTEANEAAIKLARRCKGPSRNVIVGAWGGFHGRTFGSLAATGQPQKWEGFAPLPEGFRHFEWNNVDDLAAVVDETVAAIILEPIQGEGGVHPASADFMAAVKRICKEQDILLILDEVQTGLGRTGKWFGFQHHDIVPDIVTLAKALGNGFPIGACWAKSEVANTFSRGDHGSTYGGQPLAAAVSLAVIETMESLNIPAHASAIGRYFREKLLALSGVSVVRGSGLLVAAELVDSEASAVAAACLEKGLIVNAVSKTALRFAPPLLLTEVEIDAAISILEEALEETYARKAG